MTEISVAIIAVPEREARANQLAEQLLEQGVEPWIFTDHEHRGPWWNARRAWLAGYYYEGYHLVLQDDAVIARDLIAAVERAHDSRPDALISYFSFASSVLDAHKLGQPFVELTSRTFYGVAVSIARPALADMIGWIDEHEAEGRARWGWSHHDDVRLSDWARAAFRARLVTAPNLVDHAPGPSVANPDSPPRSSACFMAEGAASNVNWTSKRAFRSAR